MRAPALRRACVAAVCALFGACMTVPPEAPEPDADPTPAAAPAARSEPMPAAPAEETQDATAVGKVDTSPRREAALPGAPSIRFKQPEKPEDEDDEVGETQRGKASWYGAPFHGRTTANGERYNMYELTAAHKTLPFGTLVKVKDLNSGRSVDVRINDRGPYVDGRVIDLSKAAAEKLGMAEDGVKPVSVIVKEWPTKEESAYKSPPGKAAAKRGKKAGSAD